MSVRLPLQKTIYSLLVCLFFAAMPGAHAADVGSCPDPVVVHTCASGTVGPLTDDGTYYLWMCGGTGGSGWASCSVPKVITTPLREVIGQTFVFSSYAGTNATYTIPFDSPGYFEVLDSSGTKIATVNATTASFDGVNARIVASYAPTALGTNQARLCVNYNIASDGTTVICGSYAAFIVVPVPAAPTGCAYGTDASGDPLTVLRMSTESDPFGGQVVPGGEYKAPTSLGLGDICFRNDSTSTLFVPIKTAAGFSSFWAVRERLGLTLIP